MQHSIGRDMLTSLPKESMFCFRFRYVSQHGLGDSSAVAMDGDGMQIHLRFTRNESAPHGEESVNYLVIGRNGGGQDLLPLSKSYQDVHVHGVVGLEVHRHYVTTQEFRGHVSLDCGSSFHGHSKAP